ncbi:signal peptidase I [[Clostridium] innocuum]|nr:signal peptidase I [[Clostridium] innocuum]
MIILLVSISLCSCGHFRIFCITSGSMEPTISTGSLILVDTDAELHTEDIVTFQKQDSIITHRIVRQIDDQRTVTKGDANDSDDPTPLYKTQIIGKVILVIPYIGYIVLFIRRYLWLLCAAFLAWQLIRKKKEGRKSWKSETRKK